VWRGTASAEARARAEEWAETLGGTLLEVRSSPEVDDFSETLALIERPTPVRWPSPHPIRDEVHDWLPQASATSDPPGNDSSLVARGRAEFEGIAYHLAVASSGPTHAVAIFAVRKDEESLYRGYIERALSRLEGMKPPVWPFRPWRFRLIALVCVGATAAGLWFGLVQPGRGPRPALVRWAAAILATSFALAAVIGFIALGPLVERLALAGTSRGRAASEILALGFVGAGALLGIEAWLLFRRRRVQSAPPGGVFATVSRTMSVPTVSATGGQHHPDGHSELVDPSVGANVVVPPSDAQLELNSRVAAESRPPP